MLINTINYSTITSGQIYSPDFPCTALYLVDCPKKDNAVEFLTTQVNYETYSIVVVRIEDDSEWTEQSVWNGVCNKLNLAAQSISLSTSYLIVLETFDKEFKMFLKTRTSNVKEIIIGSPTKTCCELRDFCFENFMRDLKSGLFGSYCFDTFFKNSFDIYKCFDGLSFVDKAVISGDRFCYDFFKHFEADLLAENEIGDRPLENVIKHRNLNAFRMLLELESLDDCDIKTVRLNETLTFRNPQNQTLLMMAVECNFIAVVEFLLSLDIYDVNESFNGSTPLSFALNSKYYEISLLLLQNDAKHTIENTNSLLALEENNSSDEFKRKSLKIIQDIADLHKHINSNFSNNTKSLVLHILNENKTLSYFFNTEGESIAVAALKANNFEAYEFLLSNGIKPHPDEDIKSYLSDNESMIETRNIHRKLLKTLNDPNIMKLLSQSRIGHEATVEKRKNYFPYIVAAFEILNEVPVIRELFEIVVVNKKLTLIFEFDHDTVERMDPTMGEGTWGVTYLNGYIYIGVKALISGNDEQRRIALGTIAHEICHYAMQLMFENYCKPYGERDSKVKKQFVEIVEKYENFADEPIISRVYTGYPKSLWPAELIVRVPEIFAHYINDSNKLEQLKVELKDLFDFYEKLRNKAFTNGLKFLTEKEELEELNKLMGEKERVKAVSQIVQLKSKNFKSYLSDFKHPVICETNSSIVTLSGLFQHGPKFNIFTKISSILIPKQYEMIKDCHNSLLKPLLIIKADNEGELSKAVKILENFNERIILVTEHHQISSSHFERVNACHTFCDLKIRSQHKVSRNNFVLFQGKRVKLEKLANNDLELMNQLPFEGILNQHLSVGEEILDDGKFYYERKMLVLTTEENIKGRLNKIVLEQILEKTRQNMNAFLEHGAKLDPSSVQEATVSFDDITDVDLFLLSDQPGMGKSTSFRKFAYFLKTVPAGIDKWVLYIDLKLFFNVFKKYKTITSWTIPDITEMFSEMMRFKYFEKLIFQNLLLQDKAYFLIDGIDEISPNYSKFILNLCLQLRKLTKCHVWVASRPHCIKAFESEFKVASWRLLPIEEESFLTEYFRFMNFQEKEENAMRETLQKVRGSAKEQQTLDAFKNPMIIIMITKIYKEIDENDNLYSIYDKYIKLIFRNMEVKGELRKKDFDNLSKVTTATITEMHQMLAVQSLVDDKILFTIKKLDIFNYKYEFTIYQLLGLEILCGRTVDTCFFIHKTFPEFLIAKFIIETLLTTNEYSKTDLKCKLTLFFFILTHMNTINILNFMNYGLSERKILIKHDRQKAISKRLAECLNDVGPNLLKGDFIALVNVLVKILPEKFVQVVEASTENEQWFWKEGICKDFNFFWTFLSENMNQDVLLENLLKRSLPLVFALRLKRASFLMFLGSIERCFSPTQQESIYSFSNFFELGSNFSFFEYVVFLSTVTPQLHKRIEKFKFLMKKLKEFTKCENSVCNLFLKILMTLSSHEEGKQASFENVLNKYSKIMNIEPSLLLCSKDNELQSITSHVEYRLIAPVLVALHENFPSSTFKKIFLEGADLQNIFHQACRTQDTKLASLILFYCENYLTREEFKRLVLESRDDQNRSPLKISYKFSLDDNREFYKCLRRVYKKYYSKLFIYPKFMM